MKQTDGDTPDGHGKREQAKSERRSRIVRLDEFQKLRRLLARRQFFAGSKRPHSGEQFIQHDAQTEDVGLPIDAMALARGRPDEASTQQLNGWLKDFENLHFAHSFLFNVCYPSESSADRITAEHLFWAETLANPPRASVDYPAPSSPHAPRQESPHGAAPD